MDIRNWTGKYVIVYGARRSAIFTLITLINQYQKVDYICLEDDSYSGLFMLNRKVISLDEAKAVQKDSLIVAAPQNYEKLCAAFSNIYLYENFGKVDKIEIGSILPAIRGEQFYNIISDSKKYRLVIYGTDETAKILNDKLELMDINVEYFVDESNDGDTRMLCDKKIRSVYDLIYENTDSLMIINTCKDLVRSTQVLTGLGLEECKDFRYIQQYQWNFYRWNHWLDPQLGYNMVNEECEKYPGFFVYGNDSMQDYRIVLLGGSTVDATLYPFRSWPEILYEIISRKGYQVTVYAGGTWGYPVETEVFKLIRDALSLEPDMIIDYSGVNNLVTDDEYPFCNTYQKQFYEKISAKNVKRPVTYGIYNKKGRFTQWLSCQRMMRTVCSEFGIDFISVLQPLLGAKERYSDFEKEIMLNITTENDHMEDYIEMGKQFSYSVKKYVKKYKWLHDYSNLLDEYEDVYIDKCHVNERGNEIIAWRIWELIRLKVSGRKDPLNIHKIKKMFTNGLIHLSNLQGEKTGIYFYPWQKELQKYKKMHQGETAYLIGSCSAIKNDELEKLKGKITFCCDTFYRSYRMCSFRPTYTVSIHNKIIENFGNEIIKNSGSAVWFCTEEPVILGEKEYHWLYLQKEKLRLDDTALQAGVYDTGVSLLAALQIGWYMGIRKFVFYNIEKDTDKEFEDQEDKIQNRRFDPYDFDVGFFKNVYSEMAEFLTDKGGRFYNASETTELPYTDKISFEEGLGI